MNAFKRTLDIFKTIWKPIQFNKITLIISAHFFSVLFFNLCLDFPTISVTNPYDIKMRMNAEDSRHESASWPEMLNFTQWLDYYNVVLVPYMDSALNMDTPNIFKSNKFYRHMALRARKEKQLKR